ncbi:hypothetical protein C8T65DRAFT_739850 [Cerioporus squamosus]|nr:hypothetical protein C8T65DRAFT_739850 [Cerioporus squamosus]
MSSDVDISPDVVLIISGVPLIVADILLICITWVKLSSRDTLKNIVQSRRPSLSDVLFRDGMGPCTMCTSSSEPADPITDGLETLAVGVLFCLNVLHLFVSLTAMARRYIVQFTAPITAILVSRFLLELQENLDDDMPNFISSFGACISPDLPTSFDDSVESHVESPSVEEGEGEAQASQADASSTSFSA